MKKFALLGAAGYVAPRHIKAIKDTGNDLIAIVDPAEGVGIIDSYFPRCQYYKDPKDLFAVHADDLDFVSICTPNHLHYRQIIMALIHGCNVICEKPVVMTVEHLETLKHLEQSTGKTVYTVLQLRLHPEAVRLKKDYPKHRNHVIDINYLTPRGPWYEKTWKGSPELSGGILFNIGVHLFDLMIWLFGDCQEIVDVRHTLKSVSGVIRLEHAYLNWSLSIDGKGVKADGATQRYIKIDKDFFDMSKGFENLHTCVYTEVLDGKGIRLDRVLAVTSLVESLNNL